MPNLTDTLDLAGHPVYKNLAVPGSDPSAEPSEVEALILTAKGIFVLESVDCAGWIFGRAGQRQWTVSLAKERRERFENPVRENRVHVRALATFLGLPTSAFRSFIVFADGCVLKEVPADTAEYCICQRPGLRSRFAADLLAREAVFSAEHLGRLKARLDELAAASPEDVREALRSCPLCGKPLVERQRKSDGSAFIGCSGYPSCRYTRASW